MTRPPSNQVMIPIIDADTGEILEVYGADKAVLATAEFNALDESKTIWKIKKEQWPPGGKFVGQLVEHILLGIIVYQEDPNDCIILHRGDCRYWQLGC